MHIPIDFLVGFTKSSVRFKTDSTCSKDENTFFASVNVQLSKIKLIAIFCPNFSLSSAVGLSSTIFPPEIIITLSQMCSTS